jgi:mono/diheme cytochrome c family protein
VIVLAVMAAVMVGIVRGPERAALHGHRVHVARAFQARDDAERGKQVYLKYGCYQCHGRQGQGSSAGARLAPAPMALVAFARYVRQPRGEMPPYTAKVVTDQELADIHAFLRSVPRPPAVAALPFDE